MKIEHLINREVIKEIQKNLDYFELPKSCAECCFKRNDPLHGWECMMGIDATMGLDDGDFSVSGGNPIEVYETREPYDFRPEWCELNWLLGEDAKEENK